MLKLMGVSTVELMDALQTQVLSVCLSVCLSVWLGALAWFCQLTEDEKRDIDKVIKLRLRVIYGNTETVGLRTDW